LLAVGDSGLGAGGYPGGAGQRLRIALVDDWALHGGSEANFGPDGSILTSDGRNYSRTPQRLKRAAAQAAVDAGAPIATSIYPDGIYLFEGDAALDAWSVIRPRLVVGKPPTVRDLQWVGHLWVAEDGSPLLFFDGSH
jgi:hypothetical protein